ncbi:interferon-stimulated 20 kDa exonuclease-like 2 [Alosa sapidissima]|uniref:interferon-stimulated 20 kDa exonuclease-like 2 n=1 Tax=Alosa sapidissima TaxID=34773 RepID=UPI001C095AE4|nr:interferon-stimulated 20 kDa exonuclease-like 2 [Alosa sapidissima]
MSGLMVHYDVSGSSETGGDCKKPTGNDKHKRFLKSRRFLERKGFLNNKQNKTQQRHNSCPNGKFQHQQHHPGPKPFHTADKQALEAGKSFHTKFTPQQREGASSSTSTSVHTNPKPCLGSSQTKKPTAPAASASSSLPQGKTVTTTSESIVVTQSVQGSVPPCGNPLKYLAIDCEMVGTGPKGKNSELARCSIVSYEGDVVYDKFIKPINPVTDLRTRWSGIRWQNLRNATPFIEAKKEILKIISGRVVVGHAIHNDLKALKYTHPAGLTRDTSRIPLLNKKAGIPETEVASLKRLTKALFNRDIQVGRNGHSSVEDAKATMDLYKMVAVEWEKALASKPLTQ